MVMVVAGGGGGGGGAPEASATAAVLSLPHPRTGEPSRWVLRCSELLSVALAKPDYGSWFLGDTVKSDGSLLMLAPIDPIFLLLPVLEQARGKSADHAGNFSPLGQILQAGGSQQMARLEQLDLADVRHVCESKQAGGDWYYRYDEERCVAWLLAKVRQLTRGSGGLSPGEAVELICEYAPDGVGATLRELHGISKAGAASSGGAGSSAKAAVVWGEPTAEEARKQKAAAAAANAQQDANAPPEKRKTSGLAEPARKGKLAKVDTRGMKSMASFFKKKK